MVISLLTEEEAIEIVKSKLIKIEELRKSKKLNRVEFEKQIAIFEELDSYFSLAHVMRRLYFKLLRHNSVFIRFLSYERVTELLKKNSLTPLSKKENNLLRDVREQVESYKERLKIEVVSMPFEIYFYLYKKYWKKN